MKSGNDPQPKTYSRRKSLDPAKILFFASRIPTQLTYDAFALAVAFEGAFLLRSNFGEWIKLLPVSLSHLPLVIGVGLVVFWSLGFYRTLWRYASVDAVLLISGASVVSVGSQYLILHLMPPMRYPWSIFVIEWMVLTVMIGGGRIMLRYIRMIARNRSGTGAKPVLIYGAGDAGEMIARELLNSPAHDMALVGFIDDDPAKKKKFIHGAPIFGGAELIARIVEEKGVAMVVIAMPSISGLRVREILTKLKSQLDSSVELRTLPPISELVDGKVSVKQIREFDVRDLLRRDPVELDLDRVNRIIKDRCVLVSGAGGSIGSEICRQVAQSRPGKLVIFDISEASLYTIHESLKADFPELVVVPVVGDIAHRWLVERIFSEHRPALVFHAAAYKHVPLMEENPLSALVNNVIGTRVLAAVSAERQVERFVMISTDKAVRPANMMGATKRLCELIVETQPHPRGSIYCVVRFGNVMGSSGSVIPKFEKQIHEGGPVTVTDPSVTRYFMLTSEAVQLVLQAASLEQDNAAYFLDMGQPIRIDTLARDMIQLHGFVPDRDIKIEYTSLRAGEKLSEELCHSGDGKPTMIDKIWLAESPHPRVGEFLRELDELLETCYEMSDAQLYKAVARLVPDFNPPKARPESIAPKKYESGDQSSQIRRAR